MDRPCAAPPWRASSERNNLTIPIDPELLKIDADRIKDGTRTYIGTDDLVIDPRLLKIDATRAQDGACTQLDPEDTPSAALPSGTARTSRAGPSTSRNTGASNQLEQQPGWPQPPPIFTRSRPRSRSRPRPDPPASTRGHESDRAFPPSSSSSRARDDVPLHWRSGRRTHSLARSSNGADFDEEHHVNDNTGQQPLRDVLRNRFHFGSRTHDAPPGKYSRDPTKDAQLQPPWRCMSDTELRAHYAADAMVNERVAYVYDFVGYEGSLGGGLAEDETMVTGNPREAERDAAGPAAAPAPQILVAEAEPLSEEDEAEEFMRWLDEQQKYNDLRSRQWASETSPVGVDGSMAPPLFHSGPPKTEPPVYSSSEDLPEDTGRPVFRVTRHEPPALWDMTPSTSSPILGKAGQLVAQSFHDANVAGNRQRKKRGYYGGLMRQIAFRHGKRVASEAAFQRKLKRGEAMTEKETDWYRAGGSQPVPSDGMVQEYDEALQRWGDLVTGTTALERRQPSLLPPWKRVTWCDGRWLRKRTPWDWTDRGRGYDWTERLYDRSHQEAWETLPNLNGVRRFGVVSRGGETTLVQLSEGEWRRSEEALAQRLNAEREEWLNGGQNDFFFNAVDPYSLA